MSTAALRDVVVGAGLAGLHAAQQLRELGFDGSLTVVGDEPRPPYDRPPLSKRVRPRPWSGPGAALHGVRPLATLADALALREVLDRAGRLLVLGGGFVGAEVAAAARSRGSAVTVVEQRDVLLGRPLGTAGGRVVTDLLGRAGVDVRTATTLRALEGDRRGAVRRAVLSDGAELVVDAVVVGTGVTADTRWLGTSGLVLDDGVLCDDACRAVRHWSNARAGRRRGPDAARPARWRPTRRPPTSTSRRSGPTSTPPPGGCGSARSGTPPTRTPSTCWTATSPPGGRCSPAAGRGGSSGPCPWTAPATSPPCAARSPPGRPSRDGFPRRRRSRGDGARPGSTASPPGAPRRPGRPGGRPPR